MNKKPVALVTGGSRGIGLGAARALAELGYDLVISGTKPSADEAVKELSDLGVLCVYAQGSIADEAGRSAVYDRVADAFGRLDLLVNNAGVAPKVRLDLLETTPESVDYVIDTNLKGSFFMTQAGARFMISLLGTVENYAPKIINIGSVSAYASSTARAEYCMSKAGLSMMTTLFADRLAEYGIGVFELRPGVIKTDMTAGVSGKYDAMIENGLTPIKRWGYPSDIGRAVAAIASGAFPFSTGEIFNIDGGFHLRRL